MSDTPSPSLAAIDEAIAASRSEARLALLRGLRAVVAAEVGLTRSLLAEQQSAFVVVVEGLRAKAAEEARAALGRHDAALQAVVDDIRKRARGSSSVHVAQALTSTAEATIAVYHDALARHAVRDVKNV